MTFECWGRTPKVIQQELFYSWRHNNFPKVGKSNLLPVGCGRSYGDECLNDDYSVLHMSRLNRLIEFNQDTGVLKCEAGITLDEVLKFAVPKGWFLPVTPGTKFVTVGGAVANDVHGKNHHCSGAFGNFVVSFELLRSDNTRLICSKENNPDYFAATIAGLGLTGIILWVEFQLKKIESALIDVENIKFTSLEEFFQLSKEISNKYEYTVSWLDCLGADKNFGRGILMCGNHSKEEHSKVLQLKVHSQPKLTVPFECPEFLLGNLSIFAFNNLYYSVHTQKRGHKTVHYDPYFYPLDAIGNWNKLYGKRGFFQFQSVTPPETAKDLLKIIVDSGCGSFLTILKEFGDIKPEGIMSFPQKGVTFALDFANRGEKTRRLLAKLDDFTADCGGRIYPAKDNYMSAQNFKKYYPRWEEFSKFKDPKISSSFWRRVTV